MREIKYLGFIINSHGRCPDRAKISAILDMPPPHNVSTVRSFLAPMDNLLKKDIKFNWSKECHTAFLKAKSILNSNLALTHFNPIQDIFVAGDASNYGIGGVLMHRYPDGTEKAVVHVSRSLNKAEQNYSQIEKEALALVFCVKKFHRYIHGRSFTLYTDHQPLLAIFGAKKGIPVYTANRLQRWLLQLLAYNFKIQYKNTLKFGHADVLSRLINQQQTTDEDFVIATVQLENDIKQILDDAIRELPITSEIIKQETGKDKQLQLVTKYLRSSWPTNIKDNDMKAFYNHRDALSEKEGIIMLVNRIVIPFSLQKKVLNQLHSGHPGIVRMKALSRSFVYWPNIDKTISEFVSRCTNCALAQKSPIKTSLSPWPTSSKPWSRLHIDFLGPVQGKQFLLIVDSFSKWPEVFMMSSITSNATLVKLKKLFSSFGLPDVIVSDNGTQFTSHLFQSYCLKNGIQHIRTAPFHPQSNGQAERFDDTFKRAISKLNGEEILPESVLIFLQTYRSTPSSTLNNKSPAEILLGRNIKTKLDLMRPTQINSNLASNIKMQQQFNSKHGAIKKSFISNEPVYVQDLRSPKRSWIAGIIIKPQGTVMYKVKVGKNVWVRHANQIRSRTNIQDNISHTFLDAFNLYEPYSQRTDKLSEEVFPQISEEQVPQVLNQELLLNSTKQQEIQDGAIASRTRSKMNQ